METGTHEEPPSRDAVEWNSTRGAPDGVAVVPNEILIEVEGPSFLDSTPRLREALRRLGARDPERVLGRRAGRTGRPIAPGDRWIRLRLPDDVDPLEAVRALRAREGIASAQPNYVYEPDVVPTDPAYSSQYAHQITDAELAWDIETGDPGVIVAVIGTGVELAHPDLDGNLWVNPGETPGNGIDDDGNGYIDDIGGWDFREGDNDPNPTTSSHETRVAGVVGAEANNGTGGVGVVWNTAIMPLRITYTSSQVADAVYYAVDNGASVINMSFGSYAPGKYGPDSIVEQALAYAESLDVVAVATAGNDTIATRRYPAALDTVVAVTATTRTDERAWFSNYGSWTTLAAPGAYILTTTLGGGQASASGTSFAAPYVSGVAALIRAQHPTWSAQEIRRVLEYSGDKIPTDRFIGSTRINAHSALLATSLPSVFARIKAPPDNQAATGDALLDVYGTAIGDGYRLEWKEAGAGTWNLAATGTTVIDGVLGQISLAGLAYTDHLVRLVATAGADTDTDQITFFRDSYLPGWPYVTNSFVLSSPTFGDIDGDGDFEVVVGDAWGSVYAFHHDGSLVSGWPRSTLGSVYASPALGDLDGDGDIEIVVTTYSSTGVGGVSVWHHDGSVLAGWPKSTNGIRGAPVLADVDGDGALEIVVAEPGDRCACALGCCAPSTLHVWNADGTYAAGWPVSLSPNQQTSPVVGDLDNDGELEIVVDTRTDQYVFNGDGTLVPGWPRSIDGAHSEIAIADLDGDGMLEIVSVQESLVEAIHIDGSILPGWPRFLPWALYRRLTARYRRLSLGDLDGDTLPEVVLGREDGSVHAWRYDGTRLPGWPKLAGGEVQGAPVILDVDSDGRPDVVVGSFDNLVYAWSVDGALVNGFPKRAGDVIYSSPALLDLDGDTQVDLIVGAGREVRVWGLGARYDPFTVEWDRARHDPHNTGYYPSRFFAEARINRGTDEVVLRWDEPSDVPTPTRYAVYRDREFVGYTTATSYLFGPSRLDELHAYGTTALDETGSVRARSLEIEAVASQLPSLCGGEPDTTPCDDGDPCTRGDACQAGVCSGANPAPDGTSCNDWDPCTQGDACQAGACAGTTPAPDDTSCNDWDPCTQDDACLAGACVGATPAPDGTGCDDGNLCTWVDTCQAGVCTGADPVVCTPLNACHDAGSCDPLTGCSNPAKPDGTTCDDADACTQTDACQAGVCTGSDPVVCTPVDGCRAGICEPITGLCANPARPDGTACDDGDGCTQTDACQAGVCTGTDPVLCTPLDGCHDTGRCDPVTGLCSDPAKPDRAACDDGDPRTQGDVCRSGVCEGDEVPDNRVSGTRSCGCQGAEGEPPLWLFLVGAAAVARRRRAAH